MQLNKPYGSDGGPALGLLALVFGSIVYRLRTLTPIGVQR